MAIGTDRLDALYRKLKPKGVTMTALLAKACGVALEQHPLLYSVCTPDGSGVTYNERINIAMAVAMPDGGLITPVLKDADSTDIYTLSRSWADLVGGGVCVWGGGGGGGGWGQLLLLCCCSLRFPSPVSTRRPCRRLCSSPPLPLNRRLCSSPPAPLNRRLCSSPPSSFNRRRVPPQVKRARAKQLSPDEFTTGTFTVSNLGMFGVESFDAILPPGASRRRAWQRQLGGGPARAALKGGADAARRRLPAGQARGQTLVSHPASPPSPPHTQARLPSWRWAAASPW
jgi:hypothetical protein